MSPRQLFWSASTICVGASARRSSAPAELLDDDGEIIEAEVGLDTDCLLDATEQRAKCASLEAFGRALHGAQDFYSHSNWADAADPARPVGADNPPGLNLPAPSPVLDLRGDGTPSVPAGLSTGCFVLRDSVPGVGACERRITHAGLNKDTGLIDPGTGAATDPTTPRGEVESNFARAVTGATVETRHQWQDLQRRPGSQVRRGEGVTHGVRPYPRRSGQRLSGSELDGHRTRRHRCPPRCPRHRHPVVPDAPSTARPPGGSYPLERRR